MKKLLLSCAFAALTAGCVTTPDAPPDPALLAQNYELLRTSMCPASDGNTPFPPLYSQGDPRIEPMQVFNNLFFLGSKVDTAWALTTSDGIILFDAMFANEIEEYVEDGLRALGRDPADIKYVVVSHGHADHFGGAARLQERYGAEVIMSAIDWAMVEAAQDDPENPKPHRDTAVEDGDTLTLGDATIRFVQTPGHTAGTISSLIPIRDRDHDHLAALWGGTALNFATVDAIEDYKASLTRFRTIDRNVDVVLSNHAYADGAEIKMAALRSGVNNPFVVGRQGFQDWLDVIEGCADEWLAVKQAAAAAQPAG
jgi:metallo-beta-lactamase class B